ncbi:hypothetical protein [Nesterenkonia jeotgali]|uniref:Uncharacterized protein n=1 Tax=Nesterenkonia jeotgali TaxID=317018 RepID=A0A0W8IFW4_9MICC|nr:hypothetical protein [Nesterenkonia jeotgali]KUG58839.1 hypothetical protein AVL63_02060 [Nesterenkonia jeotgali]
MTFFPFPRTAPLRRRGSARTAASSGAALGLLGVLLLTSCGASTAEQAGTPAAEPGTGGAGVQQQVPEPAGNQLSHDEMREQLESRYPDAALSDTEDYWAGLRDIETELQRLVVDPPECKQFVMRSALPVPAGALVAYADGTVEAGDAAEDPGEGSGGGSEEGSEGDSSGGSGTETEGEPEAGVLEAAPDFQLASNQEQEPQGEGSEGEGSEGEGSEGADSEGDGSGDGEDFADGSEGEIDSGSEGSEDSDSGDGDSEGGDSGGDDSEEESEPVTVDLPAQRQAVIYTFRDWRAADAHLAAEEDGLESCDSYTASRGSEDSPEVSTSVDTVDVSSTADDALGTTRRISSEGEREHDAAVTLRSGSHIVTVAVPLSEALSEEEAEVAAEELQAEAADLIESLD